MCAWDHWVENKSEYVLVYTTKEPRGFTEYFKVRARSLGPIETLNPQKARNNIKNGPFSLKPNLMKELYILFSLITEA